MYTIVHQLESTAMVPLGPHNIVEQQAVCVPKEMAEFYEIFRVNDEGPLPTLLLTTMPGRILDPAEDALMQNTGNVIGDADQVEIKELPIEAVGYPDNRFYRGGWALIL